jgi:hypothetical protein
LSWANTNKANEYEAKVVTEWTALDGALATIDSAIATKTKDFFDIGKSADDLKSRADSASTQLSVLTPPRKFKQFQANLLAYYGQTSKTLAMISNNCAVWSATNMAELERESTTCRNLAKTCANSWTGRRQLNYKPDLFVQVPSTFNAMRKARAKGQSERPQQIVIASAPAVSGVVLNVPTFADPDAAYLAQMRGILREYKGLRSGLNRYIDYVKSTGQRLGNSALNVQFQNAINRRQQLLNRVESISAPPRYLELHDSVEGCLAYSLSALQSLNEGDYQTFSNMSGDNTRALSQIMSSYGVN